MCFIYLFTLQSAERVFRSLHLKCDCINSSLKQHNTQTLADLLGFLIPPWKDMEVLIRMTKYFTKIHMALCVGDWWWGQWYWAKSSCWCQECNFRMSNFKNSPTELQPSPWKKEHKVLNSLRDKRQQMPSMKVRCLKQELEVQCSPCCYTQKPSRVWVQLLALGTLGKLYCKGRKVKKKQKTKFLRTHFIKQQQIQDLEACQDWSRK